MRLNAFILALCVFVHHARAATISLQRTKLDDLDNVDLDDVDISEPEQIVPGSEINLKKTLTDNIPVKVVEEPVIDENSNDYVPKDDGSIIVKRIEVDLRNPGPPQRQEHETQNPENYGDRDKVFVAIKRTVQNAENVFNEGFQGVSESFQTFSSADEDLPSIQLNIKNLKQSFADQIEKVNNTIRAHLDTQSISSVDKSELNSNLEILESRLKFLDKNFHIGVDTLSEGVEVYSIIKEEDEAEKAIALKADPAALPAQSPPDNPPAQPTVQNPAQPPSLFPTLPWNQYLTNLQNTVSSAFTNLNVAISNTFSGNSNGNQQNPNPAQSNNPIVNFFQGISLPNIIQGQNQGQVQGQNQVPATQEQQASKPSNAQADPVAPAPVVTPAPWSPQAIIQQVQTSWNNFVNPGQNSQPAQVTTPQQPVNNNPFQQAIQNIVSFIRPGQPQPNTPQAQQPANVNPTPAKGPSATAESKPEAAVSAQADYVAPVPAPVPVPAPAPAPAPAPEPAPVNEPQQEQPSQPVAAPAPVQAGPIQQLVQNNPIIKGIQNAVQRIQGTPNPETPREEPIQDETQDRDESVVSKGQHYYGGYRPNGGINQGDNNNSDGIEDEVNEEKVQDIPSENEEIADEQIKAEELKTLLVSDKTE